MNNDNVHVYPITKRVRLEVHVFAASPASFYIIDKSTGAVTHYPEGFFSRVVYRNSTFQPDR